MTEMEFKARKIDLWDAYQQAEERLVICRRIVEDFGKKFAHIAERCALPDTVALPVYGVVPSKAEFEKALADVRQAIADYQKQRNDALVAHLPVRPDLTDLRNVSNDDAV